MKPALGLMLSSLILLHSMAAADVDSLKTISRSNLNFTNSVYKILAKQEGNVFFSPLSIQMILALTYLGARGDTAQQMAVGLQLPVDDQTVKEGFHAILTSLKSDRNILLNIANKVFVEQTFLVKQEFQEVARNSFYADAELIDFKNQPREARVLINKWVENRTEHKITNLLPEGSISSRAALVLVNAVHFKADWAIQFDPERTHTEEFFVTASESKNIDMMRQTKSFKFVSHEALGCKVLEMPYKGNKVSMVVFLPNTVDGLPALEAKLSEVDLPKLMSELQTESVKVHLPKFKMEEEAHLQPVLTELGMTEMFSAGADFTGIADRGLYVSAIAHKAFIKVTEEGSEAAAATAVIINTKVGVYNPKIFKANHPFVFHIRDNNSGALLFVGRLTSI